MELEDFLKLDELKPLSTSYTQVDNSATEVKEEKEIADTKKEEEEITVEETTVQDEKIE